MPPAVVVVEFEGDRRQGTVEATWIDTTTRCRMMVIKVALDANDSDDLSELLDAAEDEHDDAASETSKRVPPSTPKPKSAASGSGGR